MFWQHYDVASKHAPVSAAPTLALALQGGGAHGAFTWGVLDRLLQETDVLPSAIAGASSDTNASSGCSAGQPIPITPSGS